MTLKEMMAPLGDLYTATGYDWILSITHIVTEPTCPTVVFYPEAAEDDKDAPERFAYVCSTIEESIEKIVAEATKKHLS